MIRPLRDRVLVKRLEYKNKYLEVPNVSLQKGQVVAVGYGRRTKRKVRFEKVPGMQAGSLWFEDGEETGEIKPMKVKVGDFVEFSPRNQFEFTLDGEKYVMIWQDAIYGTTNDSAHSAMLWQQSAGYDREGNFMSGKEDWQNVNGL